MNPILLSTTLIIIIVVLFAPKKWAALGLVASVFYLTQVNFLVIADIDFTPMRVVFVAGFIRVILRRELFFIEFTKIDVALLIYQSIFFIIFVLRFNINPDPTDSLTYSFGVFSEVLLVYFTIRALLNEIEIIIQFMQTLTILLIPFTCFMIFEKFTGLNYFSFLGESPGLKMISIFRDGSYRCQASFRSPITAGTMGATLIPIYIALFFIENKRFWGILGMSLGLVITITSRSSGPLLGFLGGVLAWSCWPIRHYMKNIRWSILGIIVLLQIAMKAPVWYIIAKLSGIIGGHGFHRSNLINQFVNNFDKWWLIGMPTTETGDWAARQMSWGGIDVTNFYVSAGIHGGLISIILLIWILVLGYKSIGQSLQKLNILENEIENKILLWGLGSALFSHTINFISVTYFDQSYVMWYLLLAVISGVSKDLDRVYNFRLTTENNLD